MRPAVADRQRKVEVVQVGLRQVFWRPFQAVRPPRDRVGFIPNEALREFRKRQAVAAAPRDLRVSGRLHQWPPPEASDLLDEIKPDHARSGRERGQRRLQAGYLLARKRAPDPGRPQAKQHAQQRRAGPQRRSDGAVRRRIILRRPLRGRRAEQQQRCGGRHPAFGEGNRVLILIGQQQPGRQTQSARQEERGVGCRPQPSRLPDDAGEQPSAKDQQHKRLERAAQSAIDRLRQPAGEQPAPDGVGPDGLVRHERRGVAKAGIHRRRQRRQRQQPQALVEQFPPGSPERRARHAEPEQREPQPQRVRGVERDRQPDQEHLSPAGARRVGCRHMRPQQKKGEAGQEAHKAPVERVVEKQRRRQRGGGGRPSPAGSKPVDGQRPGHAQDDQHGLPDALRRQRLPQPAHDHIRQTVGRPPLHDIGDVVRLRRSLESFKPEPDLGHVLRKISGRREGRG